MPSYVSQNNLRHQPINWKEQEFPKLKKLKKILPYILKLNTELKAHEEKIKFNFF